MAAEKILIIGPSWVGDMVLAHSLFQVLKAQNPGVLLDVAAPAWTLPLLERMPEINRGIALPFQHGQLSLMQRIQFGRTLRAEGYRQAILLVNSFKSAIMPFAAGIPRRTGFLGEFRYGLLNDVRTLDKSLLPRTVDRFVALADPVAIKPHQIPNPRLLASQHEALRVLQQHHLEQPIQPILGLCPGAEFGEAKRWPAEYYAEVANYALNNSWQVWLFGSDKDMPVTASINHMTKNRCQDWGGKTRLGEAIDLMSLCHTVISNDSGLMHIAAALNKKVIAIYGSSDPHHTPPMHDKAVIEYLGLQCSPCFQRECPLKDPNQKLACLSQIKPDQIIKKITEISRH